MAFAFAFEIVIGGLVERLVRYSLKQKGRLNHDYDNRMDPLRLIQLAGEEAETKGKEREGIAQTELDKKGVLMESGNNRGSHSEKAGFLEAPGVAKQSKGSQITLVTAHFICYLDKK